MRVDDWGFRVIVGVLGFSWDVVGGDWCGVVDQQFGKNSKSGIFYDENLYLFQYSSMKRNNRMMANANVMIACFIHLHIVRMSDVKKVRKSTNSRKTSLLLNKLGKI